MMCDVYKAVRIKNWILRKNNLTGVSSDIRNGYATCEQKWQRVVKETEKAVLVNTFKGEYWFPKSTIIEEEVRVIPSSKSACYQLERLVDHAEWMAEELEMSFAEAVARRCNTINKRAEKYE